jgi:small redox-active disulfide protein 2
MARREKKGTLMNVKILGTGCPNCLRLEAMVREVATEKGLLVDIEKITDIAEIMSYGIMSTPGLVIDGLVLSAGRVPAKSEVAALLANGGSV